MRTTLLTCFLLLSAAHLAWTPLGSQPHTVHGADSSCRNCYPDDVGLQDLPSGLGFEGSDSNQRRVGECEFTDSCKGTAGCKYWGTFKLENPGTDDRWIETPSGARLKAPAEDCGELYFGEDAGFEVPCLGQGDDAHEIHGATLEFEIFDQMKDGQSLGKVVYKCSQCQ